MDMNIRNIPEGLLARIRTHAAKRNLTLRDYVIARLSKSTGYTGTDPGATYVRCSECGSLHKRASNKQ